VPAAVQGQAFPPGRCNPEWRIRRACAYAGLVFIRFLIIIAMTLSAHAGSPLPDTLTPKLDTLFKDFNQPGSPGASVMIIQNGKVLLAKGYGFANVEERTPCGPDTTSGSPRSPSSSPPCRC